MLLMENGGAEVDCGWTSSLVDLSENMHERIISRLSELSPLSGIAHARAPRPCKLHALRYDTGSAYLPGADALAAVFPSARSLESAGAGSGDSKIVHAISLLCKLESVTLIWKTCRYQPLHKHEAAA
jgi:hypothetical protein